MKNILKKLDYKKYIGVATLVSKALFVLRFKNTFENFLFISLLQISISLVFLNNFDTLISKIIFRI
jgi:hypothetical protein